MMPPRRRYVSVMIHHDGAPESHSYHIPIWAFRTFVTLAVLLMVGVMAGLVMVGPLARAALRVPKLEAEVRRLEGENAKIGQLADLRVLALEPPDLRLQLRDAQRRPGQRPHHDEPRHHTHHQEHGQRHERPEGPDRNVIAVRLRRAVVMDHHADVAPARRHHPANGSPRISSSTRARSSFE